MNAPSLSELRTSSAQRDTSDEKMEQIRELLIGQHVRESATRMAALESRMRDIELSLSRRLDALSARLEAMAAEAGAERRNTFDELSRGVAELGEHIRKISRA